MSDQSHEEVLADKLSTDEIDRVLKAWPDDDTSLPPSVLEGLLRWRSETYHTIDPAIQALETDTTRSFKTPSRARFPKEARCRTLVAFGVGVPNGGPTPNPADLRSMIPNNSSTSSPRSSIATQDRREGSEKDDVSSASGDDRMARLEDQLRTAQATIDSLVRQTLEVEDKDVTTDYAVNDTVMAIIPKSFLTLNPLSKKERLHLCRMNQGSFPEGVWPNRLALSESTKNSIKNAAKLSLTQLATEVGLFIDRNDYTTKMACTTLSRLTDDIADVQAQLDVDPDLMFRGDEVLQQLKLLEPGVRATVQLGLDLSVHLRLNVSKRVDTAMGIDHLRVDPFKRKTEDFISPETYKLVEQEAKQKQDLTWAKQGHFPGSRAGHFLGRPPPKSSGGGAKRAHPKGGGRGNRANGSFKTAGRGRGGGKGRGKGNATPQKERGTSSE